MSYNDAHMDLADAITLAAKAHQGQRDKQGEPYILHPIEVMGMVPEDCQIAAVLHDVMEDTTVEFFELEEQGVGEDNLEAINLLTRITVPEKESYADYIERIATAPGNAGRIARIVKLADLRHNLGRMTPELAGTEKRYHEAEARLRLAQAEHNEEE